MAWDPSGYNRDFNRRWRAAKKAAPRDWNQKGLHLAVLLAAVLFGIIGYHLGIFIFQEAGIELSKNAAGIIGIIVSLYPTYKIGDSMAVVVDQIMPKNQQKRRRNVKKRKVK